MSYLGDYAPSAVVYFTFTTIANTTGAPTTLSGTPAISVYKDDGTGESTTGVTLTADFDSRTGLNNVKIDTSADGTFYAAGHDFSVVITTGTVGGTSVVGYTVGTFSINNRSALRPTTAGRTLDVSSGGEAGLDWANVGSPTTTVGLSGTTVKTATDVETDTQDIQSRLPAALVSGRIDASVGAMASDTVSAAAVAADAVAEIQSGLATSSALSTVAGYIDTEVAAIKAKTDNLPAAPASTGDVTGVPDALLDSENVESGLTVREALRLIAAALAGKLSGAATTTITIRNTADSKNRITATVDSDGNRSAVTYDLT